MPPPGRLRDHPPRERGRDEARDAAPAKKVFIKSYGCQMNVYDAQRMADALAGAPGSHERYVETPALTTPTSSSSTPATSARRRPRRSIPSSAACA